ncbi:MAG TPA: pantetheine-phosphate adenylyltransferase [Vicinamibacterales bacterium]
MTTAGRVAICPGSFDPLTLGHVDLVRRAAALFERIVIGVLVNEQKQPLLPAHDRVALARAVFVDEPRIEVETFGGLLVDFARQRGARVIVRGLRSAADFDYESPMALMNRRLHGELETVFLVPSPDVHAISSRLVKEIWRLGGDVSGLVPPPVEAHLRALRATK